MAKRKTKKKKKSEKRSGKMGENRTVEVARRTVSARGISDKKRDVRKSKRVASILETLSKYHRRFVEEYVVDHNATRAARRAGTDSKHAWVQGRKLLHEVSIEDAIKALEKEYSRQCVADKKRVEREIDKLCFTDITNFIRIEDGHVLLENLDNLTAAERACIQEISESRNGVKIKLYDKIRALELRGKGMGMWANPALVENLEKLVKIYIPDNGRGKA